MEMEMEMEGGTRLNTLVENEVKAKKKRLQRSAPLSDVDGRVSMFVCVK